MNQTINNILANVEGRYLTKSEQQQIREWAEGFDARAKAATEVESKERDIVEGAMGQVMKSFPDLQEKYQDPDRKGREDFSLTLRYATLAMVKDDMKFLDDALLRWFRTILSGLGFSGQFLREAYTSLQQQAKKHLSAESYALMEPYLARVVEGVLPLQQVA
jgi:hypothetical protein